MRHIRPQFGLKKLILFIGLCAVLVWVWAVLWPAWQDYWNNVRVVSAWPTIGEPLTMEGSFARPFAGTNIGVVKIVRVHKGKVFIYQESNAEAVPASFGRLTYRIEMPAPLDPGIYEVQAWMNGVRRASGQLRLAARQPWRANERAVRGNKANSVAIATGNSPQSVEPDALVLAVRDKHLSHLYEAARQITRAGTGESATRLLIPLINDRSGTTRESTALALAELGPAARRALPDMKSALDDELPAVRLNAARAVWRIGGDATPALPILISLLGNGDVYIRRKAACLLAEIGPEAKPAVPALRACANDAAVREAADLALGSIGVDTAAAEKTILELLQRRQNDENYIPRELDAFLGTIGGQAVPALANLLLHPDSGVRRRAAIALAQLDTRAAPAVPALRQALLDKATRDWAAVALGRIGSAAGAATPELLRALDEPDDNYRLCLIQALGAIAPDSKQARSTLTRLHTDANPDIRRAAEEATLRIKGRAPRRMSQP